MLMNLSMDPKEFPPYKQQVLFPLPPEGPSGQWILPQGRMRRRKEGNWHLMS